MDWTITQIALVVLCAMGSGLIFSSLGYAPVLGYIITGIALGPSGFKLIADRQSANLLSELGIMLLLFVIGLGLSFEKIKNIWKSSVGITIVSLALTMLLCFLAGTALKLSFGQILLITFCLSLSSTAVTVKSLKPSFGDNIGSNSFGILIVQDVLALLMVLVLNMFGSGGFDQKAVYKCCAIGVFVFGILFYFAKYHKHVDKLTNFLRKHTDMISIMVFGLCLGGALLAEFAGLSAAFGAFIMGLILGNSNLVDKVKTTAEPVEELLLMTFFLGVGLMVDLDFIWFNIWLIALALLFVMFGKTLITILTLRIFRFTTQDSFIISVLLAHVGEFSFMLVYTALRQNIIDVYGMHFLVSVTALSLFFSPFWVKFAERCRRIARSVTELSAWEFFKLANKDEFGKCRRLLAFVSTVSHNSMMLAYNTVRVIRRRGGTRKPKGETAEVEVENVKRDGSKKRDEKSDGKHIENEKHGEMVEVKAEIRDNSSNDENIGKEENGEEHHEEMDSEIPERLVDADSIEQNIVDVGEAAYNQEMNDENDEGVERDREEDAGENDEGIKIESEGKVIEVSEGEYSTEIENESHGEDKRNDENVDSRDQN